MKLIRFGEIGREKPGVLLEDGTRLDVSGFGADYDEEFFANDGLTKLQNWRGKVLPHCAFEDRCVWGRRFAGRARWCASG
jgi:hypothetical protein